MGDFEAYLKLAEENRQLKIKVNKLQKTLSTIEKDKSNGLYLRYLKSKYKDLQGIKRYHTNSIDKIISYLNNLKDTNNLIVDEQLAKVRFEILDVESKK